MVSNCDGFEDLDDFRKKRVRKFRNNESEDSAASRDQSSCLRVGVVAKLLDGPPNALGEFWVNCGNPVDSARDRGRRHPGPSCDLMDIQGLFFSTHRFRHS